MSRPASGVFSDIAASVPLPSRINDALRSGRSISRPASRSSSRGRRDSISENISRRRSVSLDRLQSFSCAIFQGHARAEAKERAETRVSVRPGKIKRWDGNARTTSSWDSVRRDPELWFPNGDCLVHFYAQGQSRRGPSLRLRLADVESANCRPLLERACSRPVPDAPSSALEDSLDDGCFGSNPNLQGKYELFIPAPAHLDREAAFAYHLTTRNFFAWMFEKPLVGTKLGRALIDVLDRMNEFRPDSCENEDDFLAYVDAQGYTDFVDCPDHALSILQFAEKFQFEDLWTDAFVHCVGMNASLGASEEFAGISRTTNALIVRANLEMDLRLERVSASLANFLEDDLPNSELGLSNAALKHMERFRSFFQCFYVQRHGYWPPHAIRPVNGRVVPLAKSTLLGMYADFRNLYEFLVDSYSNPALAFGESNVSQLTSTLQLISTIDRRGKFTPLPHPLPRLPAVPFYAFQSSHKSGFAASAMSLLRGGGAGKRAKREHRTEAYVALGSATNNADAKVANSSIVREYCHFEREYTLRESDNLSSAEARKLRWVLVYAILQNLISVTKAPTEVRDASGTDYPLCCQTAGTPPWKYVKPTSVAISGSAASSDKSHMSSSRRVSSVSTQPTSIDSAVPLPLDVERVAGTRRSTVSDTPCPEAAPEHPPTPMTFESLVSEIQRANSPARRSSTTLGTPNIFPPPQFRNFSRMTPTPPPIIPTPQPQNTVHCPRPTKPSTDSFLTSFDVPSAPSTPVGVDADSSSLSSGTGSAPTLTSKGDSEPETPTTVHHSIAPPSPSIYDGSPGHMSDMEDDHCDAFRMPSAMSFGKSHKRDRSSELAQQWRQEIKWRQGPGWDGDATAILIG